MPDAASPPDNPETTGYSLDPLKPSTSAPTEFESDLQPAATAIGPYHLLQKIAEGGMGEVWLAEQKQPVRRRVAIKLIKAGMDSREVVLRFESERQALALMDHPCIAKVYDAGSTLRGSPYFVMEYVPGVPISTFCDTHKLSTRQRLQLFIHVCEGVQHAHQKAIIHRDLKPSNILVVEVDGQPSPKIIDFGVAKAVSQRLIEQTMFTRVGSVLGTPEYMSPEQAGSDGEDIDTRSDVYSLGVVLYELLAGAPPLDLKAIGYFEFARKLRETDTPKPSTKVRSLASSSVAPARNGSTGLMLLAKELRGDLDCITLKCLEKDRNRRYGSPSELAADLHRYLQHLPVLATPPSAAYRLRKFAQRNRGLLAAVCALLIVLVAGTLVSVYQAVRARKAERAALLQRDRADAEAATAAAVNEFLQKDLLSEAGADQQNGDAAPDPDVKVKTLVNRAAAAIPKKFAGKPLVEADLRDTLANTYLSLGMLKEAENQARESVDLNTKTRGLSSEKTIDAMQALATIQFNAGRYADSVRYQERVLEAAQKSLGPQNSRTLTAMQSAAVDYMMMGDPARAEPLLKKVLDLQVRSIGYDDSRTLDTSDSLATLYLQDGRYNEARKLLERGLQSYQKVYGPDHPNTQRELFGFARILYNTGDYAKAEQLCSAVYQSNLRLLGASHFKTLAAARTLSRIYEAEGKLPEAESLATNTLRQIISSAGNDTVEAYFTHQALASIYEKQNNYRKAEVLLREDQSAVERVFDHDNPEAAIAAQLLGSNLLHQGQCEQAARYLEKADQFWQAHPAPNWRRFQAQSLLGAAAACNKEFGPAEKLLLSGYQGLKESAPRMPAREQAQVKEAATRLQQLYTAWKKPEDEQRWQAAANQ